MSESGAGFSSDAAIDQFYIEIGRRVRLARTALTQAQLARRIDLTRPSVANLEAGRQRIPIHTFLRLAHALGVSPTALLPELETGGHGQSLLVDISAESESAQEFIRGALASLGIYA